MDQVLGQFIDYLLDAFLLCTSVVVSQIFRIHYVDQLANVSIRLISKVVEYTCIIMGGYLVYRLWMYQSTLYFLLDSVLAGLIIYLFAQGDQFHQRQYMRGYTSHKHKLVNRIITGLHNDPTGRNN